MTAEDILISGAASADQLLDELPGLQSAPGAPVGSTIQIRGIGDARVLVLIDGQPANGALLENRDLSRISLSGVERVEVVKGPLSTLYGSDALGGVINVITQAPETGFQAEARALSGSGGRYEGDVTVSGGGPVVLRATGSWRQQEQVPGLDGTADAFARVWDFRSTLRTGASDRVRARADISYLRERQRWPVGGGFAGFNDNEGLTGWAEVTVPGFGGDWTPAGPRPGLRAPLSQGEGQRSDRRQRRREADRRSLEGHPPARPNPRYPPDRPRSGGFAPIDRVSRQDPGGPGGGRSGRGVRSGRLDPRGDDGDRWCPRHLQRPLGERRLAHARDHAQVGRRPAAPCTGGARLSRALVQGARVGLRQPRRRLHGAGLTGPPARKLLERHRGRRLGAVGPLHAGPRSLHQPDHQPGRDQLHREQRCGPC